MKIYKTTILVAALLAAAQLALGQDGEKPKHAAQAFAYGSFGAAVGHGTTDAITQIGGGGEGVFYKGLGASADVGYLFPTESIGDGIGTLSPGVLYQFSRNRKTVPFVTGGYTLGFREGTMNMVHFGGGATYWFKDSLGLRIEIRDHVPAATSRHNFFVVRIGISGR